MATDLLLEIGTEEIPASFVPRALLLMTERLRGLLETSRLSFGDISACGTPRRLALIVKDLAGKQEDARVEVRGPRAEAAYDKDGLPTRALEGFARGQGVGLDEIEVRDTEKGRCVFAVKEIRGEKTPKILPGILTEVIGSELFSKSMRWGGHDVSFARPMHWILALYGDKTVPFEYGHLKSSNTTRGHRFLAPASSSGLRGGAPIKVKDAGEYVEALREAFVIVDPEERKAIIRDALDAAAKGAGGSVLPDEDLVEEVAFLIEYPVPVTGSYEKEFLELPRDVVVNAMREHQRYFTVVDGKGALLPYFITIANTRAEDMDVVRKGNERVLRARLNDAKFYFELDIRRPLAERVEDLKGVIFQSRLGTSYEKVERFTRLALYIAVGLGLSAEGDDSPADFLENFRNPASHDAESIDPAVYNRYVIGRAAMLAKADLTTGVVGEFPTLQGVMGGVYAARSGEVPEVSKAIVEHYMPVSSGGDLPTSAAGAVVGMADKLDTICGCFAVGLIPTGAKDPYALRRQALGILEIMLDRGYSMGLDSMVSRSVELLEDKRTREAAEVITDVMDFFRERLRNQLLSNNLPFDSVDSVLSTRWYDVPDAVERIKAIESFKKHPAATDLVVAFKRVSNILKGFDAAGALPEAALFRDAEEKALWEESSRIAPVISGHWKKGEYTEVFETLASIKDSIDAFFDHVMVMVDDEATRKNRLLLLSAVRELYYRIADLSRLSS